MFNQSFNSSISAFSTPTLEPIQSPFSPQIYPQDPSSMQKQNIQQPKYCPKNNNCDDINCTFQHSQEICEYEPNCSSSYCNKRHLSLNSSFFSNQNSNKYNHLTNILSTDDEGEGFSDNEDNHHQKQNQKCNSQQISRKTSQSSQQSYSNPHPQFSHLTSKESYSSVQQSQNNNNKNISYKVKLIPKQIGDQIPKCKFQNSCTNKDCRYYHYQNLCDLNERCCRKECYFRHTTALCKYYPKCTKGIYCQYRHAN